MWRERTEEEKREEGKEGGRKEERGWWQNAQCQQVDMKHFPPRTAIIKYRWGMIPKEKSPPSHPRIGKRKYIGRGF